VPSPTRRRVSLVLRCSAAGGEDGEDVPAQPGQGAGTEPGGVPDQGGFGFGQGVGVGVSGEVVQAAGDDLGLGQGGFPLAQRGSQGRVAAVQRLRQPDLGAGVLVPGAGGLGQPLPGVVGGGGRGQVIGNGEDPELELGDLGLQRHQLGQRHCFVGGVREHRVHLGDRLEGLAESGGGGQDGVGHPGGSFQGGRRGVRVDPGTGAS
jgi:hypothetical protein